VEESPSVACLGCATRVIPPDRKAQWSAAMAAMVIDSGPVTATPASRISPERPRSTTITTCIHRGESIETFACGCSGSGRRDIFACAVAGKCCLEGKHVERAVEYLRKGGHGKEDRKVRGCDACPDALPLVKLSDLLSLG